MRYVKLLIEEVLTLASDAYNVSYNEEDEDKLLLLADLANNAGKEIVMSKEELDRVYYKQ